MINMSLLLVIYINVLAGHVIFEMACGYELKTLVPTPEDLERVCDSSLLDVIHLIFHMDQQGRFTSSIDKVRHKSHKQQEIPK